MKKKLEQTAVKRPVKEPTVEARSSAVRIGPQLHLSIEHAAIAQGLSDEQFEIVLMLGQGMHHAQIAKALKLHPDQVNRKVELLRRVTRMSRLSLAVLGYQLLGQPDYTDVAA